jgi:hypothetical protein
METIIKVDSHPHPECKVTECNRFSQATKYEGHCKLHTVICLEI